MTVLCLDVFIGAFEVWDAIPLTSTGKIDKKLIRATLQFDKMIQNWWYELGCLGWMVLELAFDEVEAKKNTWNDMEAFVQLGSLSIDNVF